MAISNFQQTIWSKKIQEALKTITSLRNHCDFQYQADSKNAKEVKKSETHKKIREIPLRRVYTSSSVKRFGQQRAWGRFRHGPRA